MAARHGKFTGVLFDTTDVTRFFKQASAARKADTADTSAFGQDSKTYVVGLVEGSVSAQGMFNGDEGAVDEVFDGVLGQENPDIATFAPDGLVTGRYGHSARVRTATYDISSPSKDVVGVSVEMTADGPVERAALLAASVTASATGTGTGVDEDEATTGAGGAAYLHVTANTRNGATTIRVQHSPDGATWADLIILDAVPAATPAAQALDYVGDVERYVRAAHTLAGSTGTVTYTLTFARRH